MQYDSDKIAIRDFVTEAELAPDLHVAPKTLRNWRSAGSGPPFYRIGIRVFYVKSEVNEWLESRRHYGEAA